MRQIALGILVTAVCAASASAQETTTPSLRSAIRGVTFSTPALTLQPVQPVQAAPAEKKATVTVGADVPSLYYFRGLRQEGDPALTFQPFVDVGVAGERASFNVGLWNSLHTGSNKDAGFGYYETDFYAAVSMGVLKATYTAYTYPKIDSSAIHEIMVSAAYDDSDRAFSIAPSAAIAFELHKSSGAPNGVYLELGVAPAVPLEDAPVSLSFPVKVGFSLKDYYGGDAVGYISYGALVGIPVNDRFELHLSGLGYAFPGDFVKAYNGESNNFVASGGFSVKF
jgi:hypothetical protein